MKQEMPVPPRLQQQQKWFARIITQPLIGDSQISPIAPSGATIAEEASQYILPSPTLDPWQRIEIYNQQYWWRLLSHMQDIFPFVTRLFGYVDFNESIAGPYLRKFHPDTWALDALGDRLVQWINECYKGDDKPLVAHAAALDLAFHQAFFAESLPTIKASMLDDKEMAGILQKRVFLQPFIFLFQHPYDLVEFREAVIKEPVEHWIAEEFPSLERGRQFHHVVFRLENGDVEWNQISASEYEVLRRFQAGSSIEETCAWLETQEGPLSEEAAAHIPFWFQEWTLRSWLVSVKP